VRLHQPDSTEALLQGLKPTSQGADLRHD